MIDLPRTRLKEITNSIIGLKYTEARAICALMDIKLYSESNTMYKEIVIIPFGEIFGIVKLAPNGKGVYVLAEVKWQAKGVNTTVICN